jgi:hypothetical protein
MDALPHRINFQGQVVLIMKTRLKSFFTSKLKNIESRRIGTLVKLVILSSRIGPTSVTKRLPYFLRVLFAEILPNAPFEQEKEKETESISVMIPCVEKDWTLLPFCLLGIETNILNSIHKISVVTNDNELNLQRKSKNVEMIHEEQLLSSDLIQLLEDYVPPSRRGWVIKQILTFKFAYQSLDKYILVIDADTVLTKPRLFVRSGKQILIPVVEYNDYDSATTRATWGKNGEPFGVSFTCHHLLLQTELVREMFDEIGGFNEGIKKWLNSANSDPWSPISDMHSYGTWLLNVHPRRAVFARWGNLRVSRTVLKQYAGQTDDETFKQLISRFTKYNSISFHHYLVDDYIGTE